MTDLRLVQITKKTKNEMKMTDKYWGTRVNKKIDQKELEVVSSLQGCHFVCSEVL